MYFKFAFFIQKLFKFYINEAYMCYGTSKPKIIIMSNENK